jgi:hypothetical protein
MINSVNDNILSPKKGAYSSKKFKPTELPKLVVEKLSASKYQKTKNTINENKRKKQVELYCKTNDFSQLEEPFISHSEWAFIPIKILKYNTPYDLDKDPVFVPIIPYDMFGSSWRMYKEYNNYNEEFLNKSSVDNELTMDTDWLYKQKEYIYNLPKYDIFTLKGYTHYGDILVNAFLRDVLDYNAIKNRNKDFFNSVFYFPVFFQLEQFVSIYISRKNKLGIYSMFTVSTGTKVKMYTSTSKNIPSSGKLQVYIDLIINKYSSLSLSDKYIILVSLWNYMHNDVYKYVIKQFYEDLTRILIKSPTLNKDLKVYRGVRDDYYLRGSKDSIYKNIGFVSTSLDVEKAQFFQQMEGSNKQSEPCCIKVIQLLKGTKALLMMPISQYGDEKEVLLNHASVYSIKTPKILKTFYNRPYEKSTDICNKNTYQLYVSEIVLTN